MKFATDWWRIMRHAWSVRFMLAAIPFEVAAVVVPMFAGDSIVLTAALTGVAGICTTAAFVARFLGQKEFEDDQTQA